MGRREAAPRWLAPAADPNGVAGGGYHLRRTVIAAWLTVVLLSTAVYVVVSSL
jgi:hypothetical protein